MGQITFKTGTITFKGGTITFKRETAFVITGGVVSGGAGAINTLVLYTITCNGITVKSGAIKRTDGNVTLTAGEINIANSAMGTGGGTFILEDDTDEPLSSVTLELTYTIDGAGSYTNSGTSHNDTFNTPSRVDVANITIPA